MKPRAPECEDTKSLEASSGWEKRICRSVVKSLVGFARNRHHRAQTEVDLRMGFVEKQIPMQARICRSRISMTHDHGPQLQDGGFLRGKVAILGTK